MPSPLIEARVLRVSVAAVWLWTAVAVFHPFYREVGGGYLARFGLPAWLMPLTCASELALGLMLLRPPMTRFLVALQLGAMATFTVLLALLEPMLLASPFGVLSKNLPLALVIVVLWSVDNAGWTPRNTRLLRFAMAIIWITEGLLPKLLFQQSIELGIVERLGIPWSPALVLGVIGALQLASGVLALLLRGRLLVWLLSVQLAALVLLPIVVGVLEPTLWVHPFGPLCKNLPLIAGTWVVRQRCSTSS